MSASDASVQKGLQGESFGRRVSVILASVEPLSTRQIDHAGDVMDRQSDGGYSLEYRPIPLKFK